VTRTRYRLACAALACGLAALGASAAPPAGLTEAQRRALAAGDVVVLDALPPQASASAHGGTALAILEAPPDAVWRVITDYRGHPRYYPRVTAAEVVSQDERRVLVRYTAAIGPFSFGFHMYKYPDAVRRRVEWQLATDHANTLFRENSGYWQVDEAERGSLVAYAIGVRTLLPAFLTRGAERDSLVDTINALRPLVETPPRPRAR
jgi:ribosome-associated toxin RatA of RatAB toxin-antitoxin module